MLAVFDIRRDELHRAGTVQGDDGDQVFNALRLGLHDDAPHAGRFELEHAFGRAARDHLKHLRIVLRHVLDAEARRVPADHLLGVVDDREVAQAEEVHLEEAQLFDRCHRVLRDDRVVVHAQRHVVDDRAVRDDDAGRMGRGVARHAFDLPRHVDQLAHLLVRLVLVAQLRHALERVVERHVQLHRHELCDRVADVVGDRHRAADVPDRKARRHRAEGDDLRDVVGAVLVDDVLDDLLPALVAEVDVEVRHADALRVQKALEQQVIAQRVDARDADAVGGEAADAGASARADRNAHALRLPDEVVDDQIVVYITHCIDRRNLIFKPVDDALVGVLAVMAVQPLVAHAPEIFAVVAAVRRVEPRQLRVAELELEVALVGDDLRVVRRLGAVRKQRAHFLLALEVELVRAEFEHVLILDRAVRLDADQDVVHLRVFFFDVVAVVRDDERDARLARKPDELRVDISLILQAVVLQLEIKIARAENIEIPLGGLLGRVVGADRKRARDLARKAGRKRDEPFAVRAQQIEIGAGLVVEAVRPRL